MSTCAPTDFPALELTKGYRALLANYLYDSGKTWGELGAEVRTASEAVMVDLRRFLDCFDVDSSSIGGEVEARVAEVAACFEQEPFASRPAKLVVEIQYMTPEYYQMRKSMNAWYKIARAEHSYSLAWDFLGGVAQDD